MPRAIRSHYAGALCFVISLALTSPTVGAEIWKAESGEHSVSVNGALKFSSLVSYGPDDPVLYPDRWTGAGLARGRLMLTSRHGDWANAEIAYEQRARLVSEGAGTGTGGGILPSNATAPFRITQLDSELLACDEEFSYRHELDRAMVALHADWGEVTIGRQAIGLGRGALFGAVDVFAPFTPLEVDREWRRGVDGIRVERRLSATSSVELLGVFGESWDDSALLGRARGYAGNVDAEVIVGKRAEDAMYAGTMSAAVGDAEAHLELALFRTSETQPDKGLLGDKHLVTKAAVGSSYTFDVGNGLTVLGEYHYSGFGVKDIEDAMARLADPTFQERFLRGDMQILGRHAHAVQMTYPVNDAWSASLLLLQSTADGSGVATPSLVADLRENATLVVSAFIPWGEEPDAGQLESEYGGSATTLFAQLSLYY